MNNMKRLLDCTLRDGGFVNDWEFGHGNIVSIFERLVSSNIDIIEIGFLDERRQFDRNRTIMPDTDAIEKIYGDLDKGQAMIVGMIDFGTCSLDHLSLCADSFLDGIRVIFKKSNMTEAMAFCQQIISKGYKLFVQPVSVTSYTDVEMLTLIKMVNDIKPYSMSIVDTYGVLQKNNLMHYFNLVNEHLALGIGIGYHSHNNFQLGFANSIELIELDLQRPLTIDGSVYGMGKGAGNAATELLAMYMNDRAGSHYDINQILEIIDVNIIPIYRQHAWGYSLQYFLAASNDCHPTYVKHLTDKRTLSAKSINEILERIEIKEKLAFSKPYIEQLYLDYQKNQVNDQNDLEALKGVFHDRSILLVGPGSSIIHNQEKLSDYVLSKAPLVVSINFIPEVVSPDLVFISNSKRYVQLDTSLDRAKDSMKLIATSNVTKTKGRFDYLLNYGSLLQSKGVYPDNSLIMFIKTLIKIGIKHLALAGFDGYCSNRTPNYCHAELEYTFSDELAKAVNQDVIDFLHETQNTIQVEFITESLYNQN